ncbi:hypothetical protein BH24GEM2_BH24GEM2_08610 [soil metagenome]
MQIEKQGHVIWTVGDWFKYAPPKRGREQWVPGRSAFECAAAWCGEQSEPALPGELAQLLDSHSDTSGCIIRTVTPEHQVRFDKLRGEPRNADVVAVAEHSSGPIAINVEAKADEPFDRLVFDVLKVAVQKIASDQRTNAVTRIQALAASLLPKSIDGTLSLGSLRYQLLTGVAGALAYAQEINAKRAVFLVHEFITDRTDEKKHRANAADLDAFVARLSVGEVTVLAPLTLYGPFRVPGTPLFRTPPALYIGTASRNLRGHTA